MDIWDIALVALGGIAASELVPQFVPSGLDFMNLPVRKYGGGVLGAYVVYRFVAPGKEPKAS